MSMTAVARRASRGELEALLDDPDARDDFLSADDPHLEEPVAAVLDLDAAWHGVHFLLNGTADAGSPPLDFIMRGGSPLGETDEDRVFLPDEVAAIARALTLPAFTRDTLTARFLPARMTELEIYPSVWDREDERAANLEWLLDSFEDLRDFLTAAARANQGILLTIG